MSENEAYLNLPIPQDDGATNHLTGLKLPNIKLPSTSGSIVDLAELTKVPTIIYCYPATGKPNEDPAPNWDNIPGAPGCTIQSLNFKELYQSFIALNYQIFGMSSQSHVEQQAFSEKQSIPFPLLSDEALHVTKQLKLPYFQVNNQIFIKRHTLVIHEQKIIKVFYPIFPAHLHAQELLDWLKSI